VGRYKDSYDANYNAVIADEGYITQCQAQGLYPLNYYPHNLHFMAWSALFQGRSEAALEAARKVEAKIPKDLVGNTWALYETFMSQPLYTLVRFGKWQEILEESKPAENTRYKTGIWHYARGLAYARTDQSRKARAELRQLNQIGQLDPEQYFEGFPKAPLLLSIAAQVLSGELDASQRRYETAIAKLERAVRLEDSLPYNEPPDWYFPVRHYLGAALLEGGFPVEAETVYWDDLRKNPNNGYALYGLIQALKSQGKDAAAEAMRLRFERAWTDADVVLSSSRY